MNDLTSKNVQNIEISGIRKFYNKVQKYPDAISLTLGQPDFNVPHGIKNAMIEAIEQNKTSYTSNAGIVELRNEISNYLKSLDIEYDSEEICLTIGGSEGLMDVFTALINKNDKVLIPTPAYPAYESCVKILGGQIINYSLKEDFSVDFAHLERIIKEEHPKIMVISYPCNPTGAILSREDSIKLYKIILDNDIIAVSDEMYAALCFDDKYYSIAQFGDLKSKVIIVGGFSKMFSMTGLRIGYVCAENRFMNEIMKVHQYNVSCAPSIVQWGAFYGLKNCMKDVEYMRNEFVKRRDYLYSRLKKMNFDVNLPMGAFYMFPSIKKFNIKSDKFCEVLLKEAKVAIVPGSAFGKGGEGYIRISYASNIDKLKSAADRIEKWICSVYN
ncbi:pyridoxal phosphate-dependent aminotransferase [Clostridium tyrobutyricum]|uniref:pyridoxal phosphate-dependent aminotransferase n=1 Tax=Clostridium tyrobutyricum TaxID=1519 RepID=UPI002B1F4404|nr:aminotransferase class I/II-fold pyridoxal phosphate-dependent enzyme [Clostridium tyrobutyricum]MEA5007426.1 aminotransferase class I/II-fold pyridoxal phosphate-dependent enzyme [Clostridium tyrobutyricum]